jgi:DNA repair ATPase RecN
MTSVVSDYRDTFTEMLEDARDELQARWDKLTDRELDRIRSRRDQLADLLQEKYNYTVDEANEYLDEFASTYQKKRDMLVRKGRRAAGRASEKLGRASEKLEDISREDGGGRGRILTAAGLLVAIVLAVLYFLNRNNNYNY